MGRLNRFSDKDLKEKRKPLTAQSAALRVALLNIQSEGGRYTHTRWAIFPRLGIMIVVLCAGMSGSSPPLPLYP
jgi:hypothetical protein